MSRYAILLLSLSFLACGSDSTGPNTSDLQVDVMVFGDSVAVIFVTTPNPETIEASIEITRVNPDTTVLIDFTNLSGSPEQGGNPIFEVIIRDDRCPMSIAWTVTTVERPILTNTGKRTVC